MRNDSESKSPSYLEFVIIGDSNVGKTTLLENFSNRNNPIYKYDNDINSSTHVVDTFYSDIIIGENTVNISMIDTAGTEKYNSLLLCKGLYKNAHGVIIVYDVTNRESFLNVKHRWLSRIKTVFDELNDYNIIIVANKIDLVEKNEKLREVTIEEGEKLTREYGLPYIMMSALYKDTIELPFIHLIQNIFQNEKEIINKQQNIRPPVIKLMNYDYNNKRFITEEEEEEDKKKDCEC